MFPIEAAKNNALPIGGGLWIPVASRTAHRATLHRVDFLGRHRAHAGVCAPALGNRPNLVTIDAEIPANANGVLYKLGANSAGLTLFVEDGILATSTTCS